MQVVERIREQLLAADKELDFEILRLRIWTCRYAEAAFHALPEEESCPLKDDFTFIARKMAEADGIILAAPTYAMGVRALMKNFIDRFAYTLHRPCFFDKSFMAVSTVGGMMGLKETLNQLAILSAGCKSVHKLGITCSPVPIPIIDRRNEKQLRRVSAAFSRAMHKSTRRLPGLPDWAYFSSFKIMTAFKSYRCIARQIMPIISEGSSTSLTSMAIQ
jgi:NAD(P)H-dependent FMN reductase